MLRTNRQKGKLNSCDTLLFNTYYNSLIGKEVDLNKFLGHEGTRFSTPSTWATRNRFKFKRVKWADEESTPNKKRTNSTETGNQYKLSQFVFKLTAKFDGIDPKNVTFYIYEID